ncbi:hypothetical protein CKAN_02089800 [Cinnamomum micranthum f. kanehirae]|uniref:Uncharacterized protein n=1 Tax=Cinnamomum micranthum f. kanehirae TaxID=337451 RepID=A0A443PLV6_9MAGN|nr:hypothetical protein CKAN_02089800 [Cinnamomum micranthum f. kanehirae]
MNSFFGGGLVKAIVPHMKEGSGKRKAKKNKENKIKGSAPKMRPFIISISRSLSSPRPAALSSRPHRIPHPSHDPSYALRQPSIIPRPGTERLSQKTSPPPRATSRFLQHPFQSKKPITSPWCFNLRFGVF